MAASRSAVCSSRPILRWASGSRRRTSRPEPVARPPGSVSSVSTESSTTPIAGAPSACKIGTRRLRIGRPVCADCAISRPSVVAGGKIIWIDWPARSARSCPRNFSTAPEANTRRPSRLKMKTASSRSCSRRSILPRRSDTSYCAPRSRWPSMADLRRHQRKLVGRAACRAVFSGSYSPLGDEVELLAQSAERTECERREQQRDGHRAGRADQRDVGIRLEHAD